MGKSGLDIMLQPRVLRWARERVGYDADALAGKVGVKPERVAEWEATGKITLTQARNLARRTHTPEGFLYLSEPPDDRLPVADLRTPGDQPLRRPSPDLLDTVHLMQARQEWMREERTIDEREPLEFVGAFRNGAAPREVADRIRETLGVGSDWASETPNWEQALKTLRDRIEDAGVLVFFNGIVGNNTHRKLDRGEFQGFALADEYAPLIFVNGADYKAAQMFTLAHELAHIFVGASGVSLFDPLSETSNEAEKRCNSIAAEFLVQEDAFRVFWRNAPGQDAGFQAAAREFKVSEIVVAQRAPGPRCASLWIPTRHVERIDDRQEHGQAHQGEEYGHRSEIAAPSCGRKTVYSYAELRYPQNVKEEERVVFSCGPQQRRRRRAREGQRRDSLTRRTQPRDASNTQEQIDGERGRSYGEQRGPGLIVPNPIRESDRRSNLKRRAPSQSLE